MEMRGGGWCNAATIASHFGPGLKSQPGCNLFFTNFCTNSYKNCYTNCILRIRTLGWGGVGWGGVGWGGVVWWMA